MRRRLRRRRRWRRGRRKTWRVENERKREVAYVGGEEDPSGSPWTTRREDPSITCVPHLFPVARTCRTSSPLQRRRWGSQVPSFALIVLGSLASRKKRVIIRGHCALADVKKIVCACSQSPMCVRWKVSRDRAAIDKWLKLPCVLLAKQWVIGSHSRFLYWIVVNNGILYLMVYWCTIFNLCTIFIIFAF